MNAYVGGLKNRLPRLLLCFCMISFWFISYSVHSAEAAGTSYYVDINGSDSNNGTSLGTPFQTIQKAASLAQAGDTVFIRGGTYRETVTPTNSGTSDNPITYQNYNGETVTISGGDLITGWTQHSGSIYKATMNWTIDSGDGDLIFVDGQPAHEARWPNASDPLLRSGYASVDSGTGSATDYTITDAALSSFPSGYWNGAKIFSISGYEYYGFTSTITNFEGSPTNKLHFAPWTFSSSGYYPTGGNEYYLFHTLNALDQSMEWYRDSATNTLYLWVPGGDSPNNHTVEAKKRTLAIDLSSKSYINFTGINFYSGQITTLNGDHNTISKAIINTTDVNFKVPNNPEFAQAKGILLGGTYNTVRDSEIKNMQGNAVTMSGAHNNVINNYIHDANYEASNAAGIQADGINQLISNNTVSRTGRGVTKGVPIASVIQYNDFYDSNMITTDAGVLALGNSEYGNTEIHHNLIHDNKATVYPGGLYADVATENLIMYNNVTYNANPGILLNSPSNFNLVFNNTLQNSSNLVNGAPNAYAGDTYGVKIWNNIMTGGISISGEADVRNNKTSGSCSYVNAASYDFHLQSSSTCIDAGKAVGGVTDGYAGSSPDIGAYEYGGTDWTAGHNFASPPNPTFTLHNIEYSNQVKDGGFESGTLASWSSVAGAPSIATGVEWDYKTTSMSRMHKHAAYLKGGDRIEQTITGLTPNTAYVFSAWAKINGSTTQAEDYNDGSGSAHWDYTDGDHSIYREAKYVGPMQNDDYLVFNNIDFGSTAKFNKFSVGINKTVSGGSIELRLGSTTGTLLGTVNLADYNNIWKWQDTDISAASGLNNVYLVFKGTGNIALIDGFKLWNSTMADDVTLGVKSYGGFDLTSTISSTSWGSTEYQIPFTTGATSTSATIYFDKPDGNYFAYIDNVGLIKDINATVVKPALEDDGFEYGTSKWTSARGTTTTTTAVKHLGTSSFPVDEDVDVSYQKASSAANKLASVWFYDDAADTSIKTFARVDNGTTWQDSAWRGIGVDTDTSTSKYVYRINGTITATNITRSTGWHEFKWDYSSGTKVDMYIDGTLVASPTGVTAFSLIAMGDFWGTGQTGAVYFDDFTTFNPPPPPPPVFTEGFESGFSNWTSLNGTASTSTLQFHEGSNSYVINEDLDVIQHSMGATTNLVGVVWFYDDASDTSMKTVAFVDKGTSSTQIALGVDTPTTTSKYVYRVGSTTTATTINRTTGWHKLAFDYRSGTDVKLYIDGTLVATSTSQTGFNGIRLGDFWGTGETGTVYFDDISVQSTLP